MRNYLGQISATVEDTNYLELALGTKTRSGGQWDIWEAVFSPAGPDGYPMRLWDKTTGEIDHTVAEAWKKYDLRYQLETNWPTLGPKVRGKLHIYVGEADTYYLNNAVYLMEDFLKKAANPPADAEVAYGARAEHCWNGDPKSAQCHQPPALQHHVRAEDRRTHGENGARRRGSEKLALLILLHRVLLSEPQSRNGAATVRERMRF
jgi:hypothetical protein